MNIILYGYISDQIDQHLVFAWFNYNINASSYTPPLFGVFFFQTISADEAVEQKITNCFRFSN